MEFTGGLWECRKMGSEQKELATCLDVRVQRPCLETETFMFLSSHPSLQHPSHSHPSVYLATDCPGH